MIDRGWWSEPTSTDEAHARAAARRHYNALRREHAQQRRNQVLQLLGDYGGLHRGVQARIARQLGVSEATISRDLRAVLTGYDRHAFCPLCGCSGHVNPTGRLRPPSLNDLAAEVYRLTGHDLIPLLARADVDAGAPLADLDELEALLDALNPFDLDPPERG
jgi:hypothetical protein